MVSSAYKSTYNFNNVSISSFAFVDTFRYRLLRELSPWYLVLRKDSKSFRNMAKRSGERLSPCLTPILQLKDCDNLLLCFTHA